MSKQDNDTTTSMNMICKLISAWMLALAGVLLLPLASFASLSRITYTHADELASTLALTDDSGSIVRQYAYSPYGEIINQAGSVDTPYTYIGAYGVYREAAHTGLYHMKARYYDAGLKRFLSKDPIGLEGGVNWYLYSKANPAFFIDPLGLKEPSAREMLLQLGSFGSPFKETSLATQYNQPTYTINETREYSVHQLLTDATTEDYGALGSLAYGSGLQGSLKLRTYRPYGQKNISNYELEQVRETEQVTYLGESVYDWMTVSQRPEAENILLSHPDLMNRAIQESTPSGWQRFWEKVEVIFIQSPMEQQP